MTKLYSWKRASAIVLFCAGTAITLSAQTYETLHSFDWVNGGNPYFMSLVQGPDGKLYGTAGGGDNGNGTVFKISTAGKFTTLYKFCMQQGCPDGSVARTSLVLATDGNLYGTTESGGLIGAGTIFRITPVGKLTTIYSFCVEPGNCSDGQDPRAGLVQGVDGNLYGTTYSGGDYSAGTIFKITPKGALTTLHSFDGSDGRNPNAGLVQGRDGNFYGTTFYGGINGYGTVFKITPAGKLTTLHTFCIQTDCPDGGGPSARMIQASDQNFYGTTLVGGSYGGQDSGGTVFKITPGGVLTTVYSFGGKDDDGVAPYAGVVQGTDGNVYGTTYGGGTNGVGTIFQITPEGVLTTLYTFCTQLPDCPDGGGPYGGLVQATNGTFYGVTLGGGTYGVGVVFSLDMGFGPFVNLVRESGNVAKDDGILGQGLKDTTDVSFHGTPATFTVRSDTLLLTRVPPEATTGLVTVTTPSGTLTSNKIFRVTPQLLNFDPPSGPVGTRVTIMGVSLTQTQSVGFGDHIPAQFTVNSDTQVTATVPGGAKTGRIGIQTKGGTAISSRTFTVTP
ncbi:MAG: hypothetical protein LAO09_11720 [Acidobacteriia bacterium]|nr:hypothetical protein [Terriglobia bacterium]